MFSELKAANQVYAANFDLSGLPSQAAKGLAVLTCVDTRIEPLAALGLRPGDAKILRNAGGRVTDDVLRSLVLVTSLLGVHRVLVMHHSDCALAGRTDEQLRTALSPRQAEATAAWQFLAMPDPDSALAHDVEQIQQCAALPDGLSVEGWRYDVETGLVHEIIGSSR